MDGVILRTYKDFIGFRQERNPCVGGLLRFLANKRFPQSSCHVHTVDFSFDRDMDRIPEVKTVSHDDFPSALTPTPPGQGRIIVIEDLHPAFLEVLGSTLDIDPLFFADYVLTSLDDVETLPAPPSVALAPSQIVSQEDWFHIHYQQIVELFDTDHSIKEFPWVFKTSSNVPRSVRRLPMLQGRQLGVVRGCCSILLKRFSQSWIGRYPQRS